jgi:hypothetical protein
VAKKPRYFEMNESTPVDREIPESEYAAWGITETSPEQRLANTLLSESARIASHAKKMGCSLRSAALFLTGKDLYKFGPPDSEEAKLAEAWKRYSPFLSEADIRELVKRGKFPQR